MIVLLPLLVGVSSITVYLMIYLYSKSIVWGICSSVFYASAFMLGIWIIAQTLFQSLTDEIQCEEEEEEPLQ